MGALGLNMAFVGRNIAAYAPKYSTRGSLQCVSSPLWPRIAMANARGMVGWLGKMGGQAMKAGEIGLVGRQSCCWGGS